MINRQMKELEDNVMFSEGDVGFTRLQMEVSSRQ